MQHGLISDNILPYFHKLEHISNVNSDVCFPLPDKMCVWSERVKESLIQNGKFNANIPIITGNPRLDFLFDALKKFDVNKISEKYNIKKKRISILFITENLLNKLEREMVARCVIRTLKDLDDSNLIIKLHPNESSDSLYKKLISEFGLENYTIINNANLYELLFYADIVIVSYSTVGVEALMMNKPVISLNLMDLHGAMFLIKEKLAVIVEDSEELLPSIKKCLKPEIHNNLIKKGKKFAEKELGIIDGKSIDRVIDEILLSINENTED